MANPLGFIIAFVMVFTVLVGIDLVGGTASWQRALLWYLVTFLVVGVFAYITALGPDQPAPRRRPRFRHRVNYYKRRIKHFLRGK